MVSIYLLDRGFSLWTWLCMKHVKARKADRWTVKERRNPPAGVTLTCDDCGRTA